MQNLPNITQSTNDIIHSLPFLKAEWTLISGFLLVIVLDLFVKKSKQMIFIIALASLVITGFFLCQQYQNFSQDELLFNGMFNFSKATIQFKLLTVFASILSLVFFYQDDRLKNHPKGINDFISIFLAAVLGMFLLISSANLLMLYLSIEMISLASYLMVAYSAYQNKQAEAGMKYVLFGAVASAMMLYGISLIYGFTGTINLFGNELVNGLSHVGVAASTLAVVLVITGIGFKLSFVPFHFWTPDAYQEAPTSVTSFLSTAPKIAAFGLLFYILPQFQLLEGNIFKHLILMVSIASLVLGNILAVFQDDVKRMMAYSAIGHTGFILILFVLPQAEILKAMLFYLLAYTMMNAATFMSFTYLENKFGVIKVSNFKGLGKKAPFIGVLLVVLMISLTGLPPTIGFISKFLVFSALINLASADVYVLSLLIVAALTTVISLFYYLKIPLFFFLKKADIELKEKESNQTLLVMVSLLTIAVLVLGLFPNIIG